MKKLTTIGIKEMIYPTSIGIKFINGEQPSIEGKLSVLNNLIMLHSPFISSQWPIDQTGMQLTYQCKHIIKLAFMHTGCNSDCYQSFYLEAIYFDLIEEFFKAYSFPMLRMSNHEETKDRAKS